MITIEKCTELFMMVDLIIFFWAKITILMSYGVFVRRQGLFLCKCVLPLLQTTSEIVMIKQSKYCHKLAETSQQQTSTGYGKVAAGLLKHWLGVCLMERGLSFFVSGCGDAFLPSLWHDICSRGEAKIQTVKKKIGST